MLSQMFTQPESQNWQTTWKAGRQTPSRAESGRMQRAEAAKSTPENSMRTESQNAEDWASDCLFDCYNN